VHPLQGFGQGELAGHGLLNEEGVNVIRPALGRPLRILGARTLSSDPDARFVPVRRLVMLLRRTLDRAARWAVFEPNDAQTRAALAHGVAGLLEGLWRAGALAGATPEAAFAVRCDETNNPPAERGNGRLRCDVAVAPSVPYEFVVLRIGRVGNAFEVDERFVRLGQGGGP
jgi:phage tail sheath protein FI